jgi:O-antigen/teichoic acid export membrane protein
MGIPTLVDTSLYLLGNQGLWFFVAAVAGSQTLGVLRLALLLANPALLIYLAAQTILVPTITRDGARGKNLVTYIGIALVAGLALFAGAALIVLPILRHVGAVTAPISPALMWLTTGFVAASAPYVITASLLRAKRHGRGFLTMRAIATFVTLVIAVAGIQSWGASAAMAGLFTGTAGAAALGLWLSTRWLSLLGDDDERGR